jgi:tetrahydromethanopterin S-methyltransferase subunit B
MSDLDKILESDHETGETQAPQISHSMDPVVNTFHTHAQFPNRREIYSQS